MGNAKLEVEKVAFDYLSRKMNGQHSTDKLRRRIQSADWAEGVGLCTS